MSSMIRSSRSLLAGPQVAVRRCHQVRRGVEGVVLLVAVANLDALGTLQIDPVLPCAVPAGSSGASNCWAAWTIASSASAPELVRYFVSGACHVSGSLTCSARATSGRTVPGKLGADEPLQLGVGSRHRIADGVGKALGGGGQRVHDQRNSVYRPSRLQSGQLRNQDATSER